MYRKLNRLIILISHFIVFIYSGVVMAIGEPKYRVEAKTDDFEIRNYEKVLLAQTLVDSDFDEAGNLGFRILANYIFGNNISKTKIDMTAPVIQKPYSEKIAMTAPVSQIKTSKGFIVQFTMPEEYTVDTLPVPNDPRVEIVQVPVRKVAVYSYSGSWSESKFSKKLTQFKEALLKSNIKTVGEPVFARYNSPFQIWFLRRNEIWMEVSP